MAPWKLTKHDGLNDGVEIGDLPGNMSETEVEEILRRLVCSGLTEAEVLSSSLRRNSSGKSGLLDRVGSGMPIHFGTNPFYLAFREKAKVCPECGYEFKGNGWDGIDAHWRAKHEDIMPYQEAWPLLKSDTYPKPQSS